MILSSSKFSVKGWHNLVFPIKTFKIQIFPPQLLIIKKKKI